jgi:integrase
VSIKDLAGAKKPRQRVLDDRELRILWRATEGPEAIYYGPFVRLLLLLGVRRSELGRAPWAEFDLDAASWTIPPHRQKSDDPHIVPLAPAALAILRSLPRGNGYAIGGAPIHYSRAKRQLDARIKALNGGRPIPNWTWHDLRRTFRTGLGRCGVLPHVAELAIGHRQPGLHRVYDQHRYDAEKRAALNAWATHLLGIVQPPDGEGVVVPLRQTAR